MSVEWLLFFSWRGLISSPLFWLGYPFDLCGPLAPELALLHPEWLLSRRVVLHVAGAESGQGVRHVFSLLPQTELPCIGKASGTRGINSHCLPWKLDETTLSVWEISAHFHVDTEGPDYHLMHWMVWNCSPSDHKCVFFAYQWKKVSSGSHTTYFPFN